MIKAINITKTYKLGKTRVDALRGVDLIINKGDFVSIMGPSGSGKSTLLNLIGCLDKPNSGDICIDEESIVTSSRNRCAEIRSQKIGFIFQSFNLMSVLNVYENIEFPLFIKNDPLLLNQRKDWIHHLIMEVGLENYIKHKPDELSGGQRQRVAIARALVTKPQIVLADEPTANLDSKTGEMILELMKKLNINEKVTFLFATHDKKITNYASSKYEMQDGVFVS